uniref:Regulator of G protein signaling 22 n=1 Tax=Sphenodon punctatus TaxID=8508 RepID=A0A8D0GFZ0_SPHPU
MYLVLYKKQIDTVPTFAEPVRFNSDFGIFEVVNEAQQRLEDQLKKTLHGQKPPNPIYDVTKKPKNDSQLPKVSSTSPDLHFDPNYTIMCLDREQGIQWIKKERLPAFLESDCYFEYRLAKLISQVEWSKTGLSFFIDTNYYPWIIKDKPTPPTPEEDEDELIMNKFYVSLGQATVTQTKDWFTLAKQSQQTTTTDTLTHPLASFQIQGGRRLSVHPPKGFSYLDNDTSVSVPDTPSHTLLRVYLERKWDPKNGIAFQSLEEFTSAYVQYIVKDSVSRLTGQPTDRSKSDVNFSKVSRVFIQEIANAFSSVEPPQSTPPASEFGSFENAADVDTEGSLSSKAESEESDSRAAWCAAHRMYDIGNRNEFERFKKFIKGTLGERYWWLWMDIERLKVLKDTRRQKRQLDRMRKLYLVSNGDYFLNSEVLFKLSLLDGDRWNIMHLRYIQPDVVKPLLLYWGPKYCVTHTAATRTASAKLKLWHTRQEKPRIDVDPFPQMVTLLPLRAKSCIPKIAQSYPQVDMKRTRWKKSWSLVSNVTRLSAFTDDTEHLKPQIDRRYTYADLLPVKSVVLGGLKMENMLQSLNVENRAGYFFTNFCEKSGNKLWKNSVYFWFDLQVYHQLFYQETLHPFKLCKQARFLYATYIAPSASMDIGLQQIIKKQIYHRIEPPFEDLFDLVEEYILILLLVPWMKMVELDKCTYGKVELVEETRQLDSVYFRKLQALHQESVSKKDEVRQTPTNKNKLFSYHRGSYSLNDLVRNRMELEQFRLFLEEHFASMDLMCWIDIEHFRRMLHKDKDRREEKSKDIKKKYLNKKYFFGPSSPATREQQEQIMKLGGGWGQILHERLSSPVLLEIQKYVQMRLEKKWLPLFMAKEQFGPRKKMKPQIKDVAEDILLQRSEKKTAAWKHVDNKWVSSSREIITFRKALLNPITAFQFQRFVSLKGDLLGNGVLFWQEVQKYKDLCHSHCDDATIQNKITAIINCFINSTIPPMLQIDIPLDQALKIVEHRRDLGPYVFREAQMTIFALLFKFWPKFCEFRSNLADEEKILAALERKMEKKMAKLKRRRDSEERLSKVRGLKEMPSTTNYWLKIAESDFWKWLLQVSWSYSKYIEALEQERVLLQIQEDLEKKSTSLSTGH